MSEALQVNPADSFLAGMAGLDHRAKLEALEAEMLKHEPIEIETRHYFADGTYTREIHIPKGVLLTGRIHLNSCINIISEGRILIVADGEESYEIAAPHTFVSGAGVKKAGYALEDTVWINVFPWSGKKDPELIVNALSVGSFAELALLEAP